MAKPVRWLRAIAAYGGTTSGAPNFAYDLCVQKIREEQIDGLDLRSWQLAFNGAEPVRSDTMARFAARFGRAGFRASAFYPCYGMAEATLFVSGAAGDAAPARPFARAALAAGMAQPLSAADSAGGVQLIGCGSAWGGQQIRIVDPHSVRECRPGAIGEIWVAGASVADRYWRQDAHSEGGFGARLAGIDADFLRTGDLGFVLDGQLYVTGRIKEVIIVKGRNHYPQDIEASASGSHAAFRANACAAFSVPGASGETLVVLQELERRYRCADTDAMRTAIRASVARVHGLEASDIVLLDQTSLPRTSSGKIRRAECRSRYLAGQFTPAPALVSDLIAT